MKPSVRLWGKVVVVPLLVMLVLSGNWFAQKFVSNIQVHLPNQETRAQTVSIATSFAEPFDTADPKYNYTNGYEFGQQTALHGKHKGADINWESGDNDIGRNVYAVANGEVILAGWVDGGYGNSVRIKHTLPDGTEICSFYAHLNEPSTVSGDVNKGDLIGHIGRSGLPPAPKAWAHLHWEMEIDCNWHATQTDAALNQYYLNPKKFVDNFNFYAGITDKVVLFADTFLRGSNHSVYPGYANFEYANASGAFNNIASSLSMPIGWSAFLYDHPGDTASAYVASTDLLLSDNQVSNGSGPIDNRLSALTVHTTNQCGSVVAASLEAASVANNCNPNPQPNPEPDPGTPPDSGVIDPTRSLVVFTKRDFVDAHYQLGLGTYDLAQREYGSISIPAGWSFILKDRQDGHESCFNSNLPALTDHESWQFNIARVSVFDKNVCSSGSGSNPSGQLVLYRQRDFNDQYRSFDPGFWDVENREYNSISIPSGWSFILKDSRDGHESCYNHSLSALTDHESWQFNIDTIYIATHDLCGSSPSGPGPLGTATIRLFKGAGHTQDYAEVYHTSEYDVLWTPRFRFGDGDANFNDAVESFQLNTDIVKAVALFEHDTLGGGAICFTGSELDLRNKHFDNGLVVANQVSSARYYLENSCDLRPAKPLDIWIHESSKDDITITWSASTPDVHGYKIYQENNGVYTLVGDVLEADARAFAQGLGVDNSYLRGWKFTAPTCGTRYNFVVTAYNHRGESDKTRIVSVVAPDCDCNDAPPNSVVAYSGPYCSGASIEVAEPMRISLYHFDNETSSLHIPSGWSVEVFESSDASTGNAACISDTKWNLAYDRYWPSDEVIDGTISNMQVYDDPNCGRELPVVACDQILFDGVALFDYTHCLGQDRTFGEPGFVNLPDYDNQASSIFIKEGWSVRVWSENTRQGDFMCFNETKWDLSYDPFWNWDTQRDPHWDETRKANNAITSIEVFNDPLCGGVLPPELYDPGDTYAVTDQSTITLRWEQTFATGYYAKLWGPNGFYRDSGFLGEPSWYVAQLPAGLYTLQVRAENLGVMSDWAEIQFTLDASEPSTQLSATYQVLPNSPYEVLFSVSNCTEQLHVTFGDGTETDIPCNDGSAQVTHTYQETGTVDEYEAIIGSLTLTVIVGDQSNQDFDCDSYPLESGIAAFTDKDCKGESRLFGQPGSYLLSHFNDVFSSIKPASGWSIEVFENTSSSDGRALCITNVKWDLAYEAWFGHPVDMMNDAITAVRVHANSKCGKEYPLYAGCDGIPFEGVVLFDYTHCDGSEQIFGVPGRYELGLGGPFNDLTSSVHVSPGWSVRVYQDSGWNGLTSCYANNMWDLSTDRYWNSDTVVSNTISSIEMFDNDSCLEDPLVHTLAAPTLISPLAGKFGVDASITFRWNEVPDATRYRIEITTSESVQFVHSGTTHVERFAEPGAVEWRVQAINDQGESDWSEIARFTLTQPSEEVDPPPVTIPRDWSIYLPIIIR